jgi:hypothetical protein
VVNPRQQVCLRHLAGRINLTKNNEELWNKAVGHLLRCFGSRMRKVRCAPDGGRVRSNLGRLAFVKDECGRPPGEDDHTTEFTEEEGMFWIAFHGD